MGSMPESGDRELDRDTCLLASEGALGDTPVSHGPATSRESPCFPVPTNSTPALPASVRPPMADNQPLHAHLDQHQDTQPARSPELTLDLRIVLGGTQISLADVRRLEVGSVVVLDRKISEPVDVFVNHNLIARGHLFVLDGRYCVRINEKIHGSAATPNTFTQDVPDGEHE